MLPAASPLRGGQTWSLLTPNRTGVGPRGNMLPAHINASFLMGYHYARQGGFRVYKQWNLDKKKLYFAFAAEDPQTTVSGATAHQHPIWGLQGSPTISLGSWRQLQQRARRRAYDQQCYHKRYCAVQHLREHPLHQRGA